VLEPVMSTVAIYVPFQGGESGSVNLIRAFPAYKAKRFPVHGHATLDGTHRSPLVAVARMTLAPVWSEYSAEPHSVHGPD
jgi:hypothetical protein